ncbi:relaxase/mobilization nuclease and DUF3363 domain-containing protein [Solimonas terrae]|uniref:Relaxase/mobilization nuclease and DUF3363 domain-containing protein n=1 Tax=Solimonas terrae TaxID=1396819 RepID=A0A6M2BTJ4_9GAMM|nr:relaxase/mobilization nuclease and DUF3363 domain-containing protein [Solimonas terrae]NGY05936.1 relaxase/mobilization nuclease and DUF3363 domain-containing protein [Solimonas terrae]
MSRRSDDDRFRVRPSAPKNRPPRFVSQVLKEASKASGLPLRGRHGKGGRRPGARFGRGHVAARFTGHALMANARRATIKTRLVNLRKTGPRSIETHLRYIEREGVGRDGEPGKAYGPATDEADLAAFRERGSEDRHQFRFIVSPEDADALEDLHRYTRSLMSRMEADLGTRLDWVAVDHWNTDNPHTHIVLRGRDDAGKDLIIARDYIAHGMRERAAELATEWLGPRTKREIQQTLQREVEQERWTSLDRVLQREMQDGLIHLRPFAVNTSQRGVLIGRLQYLQRLGLAQESQAGVWTLHDAARPVLRAMGERGDIVRTMQRAMGDARRDFLIFEPRAKAVSVVGRIAAKGFADELHDRGYLVVDGVDGCAHYVALSVKADLSQYPIGGIVEARIGNNARAADQTIAELASDGLYRTEQHVAIARVERPDRDPQEYVTAHVRRLEALRRAGIVERVAEGVWHVPTDLPERGRQYDARRANNSAVELHSQLPIERQMRAIGATWLDRQLIGDAGGTSDQGFGGEVRAALRQRVDFLVEQGLAERRGQRVMFARNLLATLRSRDVETAAKGIADDTGLAYRPIADGERVGGVYRRSVQLASGRFAVLEDGSGFSLVPWPHATEPRLGRALTAVVRDGHASWTLGWRRGQLLR